MAEGVRSIAAALADWSAGSARWFGRRFEDAASVVESPGAGWLTVAASVAGTVFLWLRPQAPGIAIAGLALVAAVATFIKPTKVQRAILIGLSAILFRFESESIGRDRAAQERKDAREQAELRSRFGGVLAANRRALILILSNAQGQFDQTQKRFAAVVQQDQSLKRLSTENLLNLTGGSSFTYIAPQPADADGRIRLVAWNSGSYILTGVSVDIMRITDDMDGTSTVIDVGTLAPHQHRELTYRITPRPGPLGTDSYWMFSSAQNGIETELLQIRQSTVDRSQWATLISVQPTQVPCNILRKEWTHSTKLFGTSYLIPWSDSSEFKHVTNASDAWRRRHPLPLRPASAQYPGGCIP